MVNSLGLVLTIITLSSNCLKLTTSLLEGYINGQVKVKLVFNGGIIQISSRLGSHWCWS